MLVQLPLLLQEHPQLALLLPPEQQVSRPLERLGFLLLEWLVFLPQLPEPLGFPLVQRRELPVWPAQLPVQVLRASLRQQTAGTDQRELQLLVLPASALL